ncbi:MAG TPA: DUF547 domain-containing protein [Planctomycetaceae bacterium]|nr:DUF547 domain-containing protein [Planctomycetaceae bacterium]
MATRRMMMGLSMGGFFAAAAAIAGLLIWITQASAKEPLGKQWPNGQYVSMDQIDHSSYDSLLQKYVDQNEMVNYAAWQRNSADRKLLGQYLVQLSQASPSINSSREGQLAFWINAYNATTLEGMLQEYPTSSIRNHTAKIAGYNIWKDLPLLVGGKPHSLEAIEHQVLRKMGEPRIRFAIVCASVGCPRLLNEAYVPDRLEEQLAMNSRDFFARSQNFNVDANGTMHVSAILDWFGEDFGATQQAQLTFLQKYLPDDVQQLAVNPRVKVTFQEYNWSINEQKAARTTHAPGRAKAGSGKR